MKKAFLLLTLFSVTICVHAQILKGKNEIGISAGLMVYEGDLAPSIDSYKTPKPVFSIYYNRLLNNYFSLRGTFSVGGLASYESMYPSKAYRLNRNFDFHTSVKELSAMAVFNLFGDNAQNNATRLSPYIFTGVGLSFVNIHRNWSNIDTAAFSKGRVLEGLAIDTAHSLPSAVPFIPLGAGVKYAIGNHLSLTAEAAYHFTPTDYLDGFSYSANPGKKDLYYNISIGLLYNFGKNKMKCPVVK